jgi:6-phosphogluconolactonase (cycloisomerase 2 family)
MGDVKMDRKILFSVFIMVWILFAGCRTTVKDSNLTMIVGTYTGGTSKGLYVYRFNNEELVATKLGEAEINNPSYLAISPDAKYVYAVSESGMNSCVNAYDFDKKKGALTFINKVDVPADPCYVEMDDKQRFVATADYSGGAVTFTPVAPDGSLVDATDIHSFSGSGVDSVRQTKPHLHCVVINPDHTAVFATDLGTDCIYRMELNPNQSNGKVPDFTNNKWFETKLEGRSGPRHLIFNKKGVNAYLINELSGKVTVFQIDTKHHLNEIQSILADTCYAGGSADIHLSPDEKFLYASTRLKGDGIVIFKVNPDGTVIKTGYQATGKHPRNFAITPDGNLMLVACKDGGMIRIFRINKETGMLTDTGKNILLDQPVCIKFAT